MADWILNHLTYIMVALGLAIGFPVLKYLRLPESESNGKLFVHCVLFSFASVAAVLLFAALEKWLFEGQFSFGAVSTYGVYLISPLILFPFVKKNRSGLFDAYAVYALPSLFLQRIRCLMSGCCAGKPFFGTTWNWPTREAELVFYAVVLFVFVREIQSNKIRAGTLFPILMMCYSVFRFAEEWVREGKGIIHPAHIWSVIVFVLGFSIYVEMKKNYQQREE